MYWTTGGYMDGSIVRSSLNGSGTQLLAVYQPRPWAIALDVQHGKVYWVSAGDTGGLARANLDGSGYQLLVPGTYGGGLALDVAGGHLYWTSLGDHAIERVNLDGSGQTTIVSGLTGGLGGIAIDPAAGQMYWTDAFTNRIERANLDGSGLQTVLTVDAPPFADAPNGIALEITPVPAPPSLLLLGLATLSLLAWSWWQGRWRM
jgi:low density lipoprotein receptor-related protein 5/6